MFENLIELIKKQPANLEEIEENLPEPIEDLRDILEGLVVMGKIERTGKIYHAVGVSVEKRNRANTQNGGNDIEYPDWVESEREKVDYLLSEGAPLLKWSKAFLWYEDEDPDTGKAINDALHTTSRKYEYTLRPDPATGRNEVQYHEVKSGYRGISFKLSEGIYVVAWFKSNGQKIEHEFKTYEELRKWILQNL